MWREQLPSQALWLHNNHNIVLRNLGSDTYPLTTPEGHNAPASVRFAPQAAPRSSEGHGTRSDAERCGDFFEMTSEIMSTRPYDRTVAFWV